MTRKDYVLISRVMRVQVETAVGNYEPHGATMVAETVRELAVAFTRDNPRFDSAVFFDACGLNDEGYLTDADRAFLNA